jgi:small subunit ribosomal protein S11
MAKRKVIKKKVVKKNIARGIVYVSATFNNTMVTVTDEMGNAIAWSSAGGLGFKGSKKINSIRSSTSRRRCTIKS